MLLRFRGFRVFGVDASPAQLTHAASRSPGALVRGDLRRLPLATASLDGVGSSYALLHVPRADLYGALAEIARVLRPRGLAARSLSGGDGEVREEVAYRAGVYRVFVRHRFAAFADACEGAGLRVVQGTEEPEAHRGMLWVLAAR